METKTKLDFVLTRQPVYPILVVDDDMGILTSMSIVLHLAGFTNVRTCQDSTVVHRLLRSETFSLVLLDLNMPHVTGHQILREAAALEDAPPLVVMTGSTDPLDFARAAEAGMSDFLLKPVERDRLIETVRKALKCREVKSRSADSGSKA
jgi:DNA-binding NtrC family response regulator